MFPPSSFILPPSQSLPFPGVFGVFYESDRPTKNALEKKWIDTTRERLGNPTDLALLQKTFDRMK
jgi:2-oxoglutarate ferredoxin oxidoreductase subunit beta